MIKKRVIKKNYVKKIHGLHSKKNSRKQKSVQLKLLIFFCFTFFQVNLILGKKLRSKNKIHEKMFKKKIQILKQDFF